MHLYLNTYNTCTCTYNKHLTTPVQPHLVLALLPLLGRALGSCRFGLLLRTQFGHFAHDEAALADGDLQGKATIVQDRTLITVQWLLPTCQICMT